MAGSDGRNRKLRDMQQREDGSFEYAGAHYRPVPGKNGGSVRAVLAAGLLLTGAIVISSGCINAAGASDSFYVIMPFIGEVCALFAITWSMIKLLFAGNSIREYVLESAKPRITAGAYILTAFACMGFALSVVYLFNNGMGGQPVKSVLYPCLKLAAAAAAYNYGRYFAGIKWEMCEAHQTDRF